jgi:hypothetical protein
MLFKMADNDNSGTLTLEEIRDVLEDIFIRYPQVELYMKNMHMLDIEDSKKLCLMLIPKLKVLQQRLRFSQFQ